MTDRFDYADNGNLDDVVVEGVAMFRLEYMDDGHIWMMCYRDDRPNVRFSLTARGKITGRHELEGQPIPEEKP